MRNLPVLEMTFPFPVMAPISSNILVLVWIPFPEIFHLVRSPNWQSAITGTGCDLFWEAVAEAVAAEQQQWCHGGGGGGRRGGRGDGGNSSVGGDRGSGGNEGSRGNRGSGGNSRIVIYVQ